jgi:hypothetical protein
MSTTYQSEINFLNRKLLTTKVQWTILPALSQIVSPSLQELEAKNILAKLRDALARKAILEFNKMIFLAPSKLQGGTRVIVNVPLLREIFSDEIDGWSGGGGRKHRQRPLSTNLTRR